MKCSDTQEDNGLVVKPVFTMTKFKPDSTTYNNCSGLIMWHWRSTNQKRL